jgi:hypothetical protein
MTPINFKVGEDEYQLLPHTGFEAINLDRKVLGLIGRMARNGSALSDDMSAFAALADTLSELGDSEYRWIVGTTLKNVTVVTAGKKNVSLSDMDKVAEHFSGKFNDLYAVLIEVWKEEKLSPFAVAPKMETSGG